ncbi:MAG: acyltransferase [Chitinophagaceae bacterium]
MTVSAPDNHTAFTDSKKHFEILDGLRGVAAIMVVAFHVFEIFSGGDHTKQLINHGYLAVDFFFALSGFVVGYAYNDRWNKMSLAGFFKRRLIRLHPMIIAGMLTGALCFYYGASPVLFPKISDIPIWKMIVVMLIGFTLVPVPAALDIRGWDEMHPLNGPAWSLFFEYVANILYALVLRRLSRTGLAVLVALAGAALIHLAVTSPNGDVIGGWSLQPAQFRIGLTRLLYPFLAGLLLSRIIKPGKISNGFLWCSALLIVFFSVPRIGAGGPVWVNGLYDSLTILLIFPLIVYLGASSSGQSNTGRLVCRFLGDISYPLYIIHYPFIYIFSAWVVDKKVSLAAGWPVGAGLLLGAVVLAWLIFRFYDLPVRKWLSKKMM